MLEVLNVSFSYYYHGGSRSQLRLRFLFQSAYFYSFKFIPTLGEIIANDRDSYKYLVESIRKFPDQKKYSQFLIESGFEKVKYENLSGGIAAIHSGWRI